MATGSLSVAAFIVGGVYLIGAAILFILRKRLFLNMFQNLFNGLIGTDTPTEGVRSDLLVVVRNLRSLLGDL